MLTQAILIGLIAAFGKFDYQLGTLYAFRPIVLCPLVGLVLGDLQSGLAIGASLELLEVQPEGKGRMAAGGSTISQQLAKNLYFTQERSFIRKAAEMFMAFRLEQTYTKDEILELYVNSIYFGDGYYCVRDASEGYFGKEPGEMTDYESTLLAGIPNAPSVYSLTANPDLAEQRQQYVLQQMEKYGYLDAQEANAILQNG